MVARVGTFSFGDKLDIQRRNGCNLSEVVYGIKSCSFDEGIVVENSSGREIKVPYENIISINYSSKEKRLARILYGGR